MAHFQPPDNTNTHTHTHTNYDTATDTRTNAMIDEVRLDYVVFDCTEIYYIACIVLFYA